MMVNVEGLKESAERIERVVEAARNELGKGDLDRNWVGLCHTFTSVAEETQKFARELARSQEEGDGDALVHVFMLRQLEITMSFLSMLSSVIMSMQKDIERLEHAGLASARSQAA